LKGGGRLADSRVDQYPGNYCAGHAIMPPVKHRDRND
jgi:hypothetical protein